MTESHYVLLNNIMDIGQIGNMQIVENKQTKKQFYRKTISAKENPGKYEACKQTINIIKKIKHENLVEIIDDEEDKAKGEIYIYVDRYELNLKQLIEKDKQFFKNQENLQDFIRQIINGYCQLMEFQVIHRDLKPENILCIKTKDKYTFKISDYGFSKVINQSAQHDMTFVEKQTYYQAPELTEDEYSFRCDFGLILAEIVLDRKFTEEEKYKLPNSLNSLNNNIGKETINLLELMLRKTYSQRVSWTQLKLKYFYPDYKEGTYKGCGVENIISHKKVWIKPINKKENQKIDSEKEEILINLKFKNNGDQNDHIIKTQEVLNENDYQYAYLILENCEGDLKQLINKEGNFTYEQILVFLEQLCKGYQFLIEQQIVHRDIKPENILYYKVDKGIIYKIADFEFSFDLKMKKKSASTKTGTSIYQAPEVDEKKEYDYQCDIFSLGITMLVLLTTNEFSVDQIFKMKKKLQDKECIIKILEEESFGYDISKIDQKIKYLLKRMITYNPTDRLSWEELIQQVKQYQKLQNQPIKYPFQNEKFNEQKTNKFKNYNSQQIESVQQNIYNNQQVQQKNEQRQNYKDFQTQMQCDQNNFNYSHRDKNSENSQNSQNSQMQNEFQQISGQISSLEKANIQPQKDLNQQVQQQKNGLPKNPNFNCQLEKQFQQEQSIQREQSQNQNQFGQNFMSKQFPQQLTNQPNYIKYQTNQNQQAENQKDEPHPNNNFPFPSLKNSSQNDPQQIPQQRTPNFQGIQKIQPTNQSQQAQSQITQQQVVSPPFNNIPQFPKPTKKFELPTQPNVNQSFPHFPTMSQQQTSQIQYPQNQYNGQQNHYGTNQPHQQQFFQCIYPTQQSKRNCNNFSNQNSEQLKGINLLKFFAKNKQNQ